MDGPLLVCIVKELEVLFESLKNISNKVNSSFVKGGFIALIVESVIGIKESPSMVKAYLFI